MGSTENYWEVKTLSLAYQANGTASIDTIGAKRYGKTANTPHAYVQMLQRDLIVVGYLQTGDDDGAFGPGTRRAVMRLQLRAKNALRGSAGGLLSVHANFAGKADGVCNHATAVELHKWITNGWKMPFGAHKLANISGGRLRDDVAKIWEQARKDFANLGGVLEQPYGDTTRGLVFKNTGGNSRWSLHYTGRAIDVNQGLAGGSRQRYYVAQESVSGNLFWRIYCRCSKQDGTQGAKLAKGSKFYSMWGKKDVDIPDGYYLDLTGFLAERGFIRIRAHSDWKKNAKGMEWWHFHYPDHLQDTFGQEMELLGISEKTLRQKGWNTDALLDHAPG